MVQRPRAAEPPKFCWQEKSLHFIAVRPPTVPEISYVTARFVAVRGQIGCGEKSSHAEKDGFEVVRIFSERCEWQSLGEKGEGELVLFITERSGEFLEQCSIASVIFDDAFQARRLSLESELRRGRENAFEPVLRQIFQWRLATAGPRQRNESGKLVGQHRGIDANLLDIAIRFGAREKCAVALFDEDMQDSVVESGIDGMPVGFPTAIGEIEFDRAPERISAVDANGGIGKIRSGFAIPSAELDDFDFVARNGSEASPEIAGEPACL